MSIPTINLSKSCRKAWLALPLGVLLTGCDRGVRPSELGPIIYADPEVPGSRASYPLPQLDEPEAAAGAAKDSKSPATKPKAVTTPAAKTSGGKSPDAKQAPPGSAP